jgi:hypothetical protein
MGGVRQLLYVLILLLGVATYASAVIQMVLKRYQPSFFSRGVWFLLGINSFAGVLLGGGSGSSVVLAGVSIVGTAAVFAVSYKYGSRQFTIIEKISLGLLAASGLVWIFLQVPFVSLIIGLVAHFIGGIPTVWRVVKRPHSEQALHWYFFFPASVLTIIASHPRIAHTILYPAYFAFYDGLIIVLANRRRPRRWLV